MLFIYVSLYLFIEFCVLQWKKPISWPPVERDSPSSKVISKCAEKTMLGTVKDSERPVLPRQLVYEKYRRLGR